MSRFAMYGKLLAQPGQRDAVVDVLLDAAKALEQMPPVGGKGID